MYAVGFKGYVPELDGLRAVAVLLVLAGHCYVPGFTGGYIGVDVFFVLSGYLITNVLRRNDDLKHFYARRARRLLPAFVLMLAAYLVLFTLYRPDYAYHLRDAGYAFFYLSDYTYAFQGRPEFIGHTWSLAVEEHFYILWPLLFVRFRPKAKALLIAYILLTLWRWHQIDWYDGYFRFDTHSTGLVLGCLLASIPRDGIPKFPAWPGLVALGLGAHYFFWTDLSSMRSGITLMELATAVALLGQPPKWLAFKPLVFVGKISYGLYLWHYMIFRLIFDGDRQNWMFYLMVVSITSFIMAVLSYLTVERWFRAPTAEPTNLGVEEPLRPGLP
jgi:peptidoglycan/LPS O-acetylase OafA/YrhL